MIVWVLFNRPGQWQYRKSYIHFCKDHISLWWSVSILVTRFILRPGEESRTGHETDKALDRFVGAKAYIICQCEGEGGGGDGSRRGWGGGRMVNPHGQTSYTTTTVTSCNPSHRYKYSAYWVTTPPCRVTSHSFVTLHLLHGQMCVVDSQNWAPVSGQILEKVKQILEKVNQVLAVVIYGVYGRDLPHVGSVRWTTAHEHSPEVQNFEFGHC